MSAHFARHPSAVDARPGIFFLVAALLLFSPFSFWVRSDPLETLLVAIAVASTARGRGELWLGICLGLAINLKVHAFFYFLPLLVDLWWSRGWRPLLTASGIAAATFVVPFFSPRISFENYVSGLAQQIGGRGQTLSQIWPISITLSLYCCRLQSRWWRSASSSARKYMRRQRWRQHYCCYIGQPRLAAGPITFYRWFRYSRMSGIGYGQRA
jgi:Glycosyltransferase family 87